MIPIGRFKNFQEVNYLIRLAACALGRVFHRKFSKMYSECSSFVMCNYFLIAHVCRVGLLQSTAESLLTILLLPALFIWLRTVDRITHKSHAWVLEHLPLTASL